MDETVDVVVVGGGINGAAACHDLTRAGYRTMLIDAADFGGGTSQASTMLIWGGLLYLKDLEFATVFALTRDRDRLVAERPAAVRACEVLYVPTPGGRPRVLVQGALYVYWVMSAGRRSGPRHLRTYGEQALLRRPAALAYAFEEATLVESDARFVLGWILEAEAAGAAVHNYTRLDRADYASADRQWRLGVTDVVTGVTRDIHARAIVNAAGGWTDAVNTLAGISTPFRHAFSRGVSLAVERDERHARHIVVDDGIYGNAMTLAPWGPVSLWGSTDTLHTHLDEARHATGHDVRYLMDELDRQFHTRVVAADVVSVRSGVRPVAVPRDARIGPQHARLTRHHRLHLDDDRPWVSVYGGKLSGCVGLAAEVRALVARRLPRPVGAPARTSPPLGATPATPVRTTYPTLADAVVSPGWAVTHEHCRRLDDYLRRRTNVAQWVPRSGLGRHREHAGHLLGVAVELHHGDVVLAERDLAAYTRAADEQWRIVDSHPDPAFATPSGAHS